MIHFILGTRAQLIKIAPIMKLCIDKKIKYNFILMPQHKTTIEKIITDFDIHKPDHIIGGFEKDIVSIGNMFFWSIKTLIDGVINRRRYFNNDKEGIVVIHGDAPPALLGALIAKSFGLKVAHVESGLRSFNFLNPFPEELIRVSLWKLRLVDYYFCQDTNAINNVKKFRGKKINTLQNTLYDSLEIALSKNEQIKLDLPKKYCLITIHRFELLKNKKKLTYVVKIIHKISEKYKILFILHPPTKAFLQKYSLLKELKQNKNIEIRPRYDYFKFIKIIYNSEFVISDGGSNQEECYYLGKPCLLLRHKTERKEGLNKNTVLSEFKENKINDFVENYKDYIIKQKKVKTKPSEIIVTTLSSIVNKDNNICS